MRKTNHIILQAAQQRYNNRHGDIGVAEEAQGLRECDGGLTVIGKNRRIIELPAGDSLVIVDHRNDKDYFITHRNNTLMLFGEKDGDNFKIIDTKICNIESEILSSVLLDRFVVLSTGKGSIYLHFSNGKYTAIDINKAIPDIIISAGESSTTYATIDAYAFNGTYTQWQAPLNSTDEKALRTNLANTYNNTTSQLNRQGRFVQPIIARYAVRLWDNSLLWVSAPVIVGNGIQGASKVEMESNSTLTALDSSSLAIKSYGVALTVKSGCSIEWDNLIKSIDVFYADTSDPVNTSNINYRFVTTSQGTRKNLLEISLSSLNSLALGERLANSSKWKLLTRITDLKSLRELNAQGVGLSKCADTTGGYLSPNTAITYRYEIYSDIAGADDLATVCRNISSEMKPATAISHSGQLYRGGGSAQYVNRWNIFQSSHSDFSNYPCNIYTELTLRSQDGERRLVDSYYSPTTPMMLNALMAFPFPEAVKVKIKISSMGLVACYENSLKANESGEFAYCVKPTLLPQLPPIDTEGVFHIPETDNITCSTHNQLLISVANNPLALSSAAVIGDSDIRGVAFAMRQVSANLFNKYPIYIFTTQGIFAMSADSGTRLIRRIDSRIVVCSKHIAQTPDGVFFLSNGAIYALSSTKATKITECDNYRQIVWNDTFGELLCLDNDCSLTAITPNGHYNSTHEKLLKIVRSGELSMYGYTINREIIDLYNEESIDQCTVKFLSHPFALPGTINATEWNIYGDNLDLQLTLYGEVGDSCHGEILSQTSISGSLNSPLIIPLLSAPRKVYRIEITGTMPTGTILHGVGLIMNK
ncbi:MAG: hypothetical protein PHR45_08730 [Muribaculaceae bacterium]|nr:hypothetical protein [Muribaculaceae bacterium]